MNPSTVKIRLGIPEDIPEIIKINAQWQKKSLHNNLKDGFVTGGLEPDYLLEVIARKEIVVSVVDKSVIGYYMVNDIPHSPTNYKKLQEMVLRGLISPEIRVALAAQSAILLEYHGRGLALAMLEKISPFLKENYDIIITSIDRQNKRNLGRHRGQSDWHIFDMDETQVYIYFDLHQRKAHRFFTDISIQS